MSVCLLRGGGGPGGISAVVKWTREGFRLSRFLFLSLDLGWTVLHLELCRQLTGNKECFFPKTNLFLFFFFFFLGGKGCEPSRCNRGEACYCFTGQDKPLTEV